MLVRTIKHWLCCKKHLTYKALWKYWQQSSSCLESASEKVIPDEKSVPDCNQIHSYFAETSRKNDLDRSISFKKWTCLCARTLFETDVCSRSNPYVWLWKANNTKKIVYSYLGSTATGERVVIWAKGLWSAQPGAMDYGSMVYPLVRQTAVENEISG